MFVGYARLIYVLTWAGMQYVRCEMYAEGKRHCRGKHGRCTLWAPVDASKHPIRRGRLKINSRREEGQLNHMHEKHQARIIDVI